MIGLLLTPGKAVNTASPAPKSNTTIRRLEFMVKQSFTSLPKQPR
jgi:hypothetical protein